MHAVYTVFYVLEVFLTKICFYLLFLLAFTSANIIFHKFLKLHSALSEKNIFVTNFPFLTDLLKPPNPLTAKIH